MSKHNLERFLEAQESTFAVALNEVRQGRKQSHWMWFIFPQIEGLGRSELARFYAIRDKQEAQAYLLHPVLGRRLIEITTALLDIRNKSALEIFGNPDNLKLKSSMTLFSAVANPPAIFQQVLDKYYESEKDTATLALLATSV